MILENIRTLDKYLSRVSLFGFSGAVLVAKNGKVALNNGYGLAIRESNIQNTADTVFSTGSITKQFTAAAIMRLDMEDKLSTTDPISGYFENTPRDKEKITLHHLLTHTAGIVNSTGKDYEPTSREEAISRTLEAPLLFKPGTEYDYSNTGYSLLAAVVEIASSKSYEEFLTEVLFKPAAMDCTGYRMPEWDLKTIADWYVGATNNGNSLNRSFPYWNILGNGGILSTTEDMYKWYLALKDNTLLSEKAKERLFTPFLNEYAYGWRISKTNHGILYSHAGANDLGASADYRWFVDHDILVIIFCNHSYGKSPLVTHVRDKISKIVFGDSVMMPSDIITSITLTLEKFEGDYKLSTGALLSVSTEATALKLTAKGQSAVNLIFSLTMNKIYEHLNRETEALIKNLINSAFTSVKEKVEDAATWGRKKRFLADVLPKSKLKSVKDIQIIGSFPFPRRENTIETVVRVNRSDKNVFLGFLWHDGKLGGVTGEPDFPYFALRAISDFGFVGYCLSLAKRLKISFEIGDKESISKLLIHKNHDRVIVVKA